MKAVGGHDLDMSEGSVTPPGQTASSNVVKDSVSMTPTGLGKSIDQTHV